MKKINYSDSIDYALNMLKFVRDKSEKNNNKYLSLVEITNFLSFKLPYSQIIEMGKYLETRGWAKLLYMIGDVKAQITASGIVHLESKGEEFFKQFNNYLETVGQKAGDKIGLAIFEQDNFDPKQKIYNHIAAILDKISKKEGATSDCYNDIEIIQLEVRKNNPDTRLLELKLNQLNNISYLADDIQELKDYILTTNNYSY